MVCSRPGRDELVNWYLCCPRNRVRFVSDGRQNSTYSRSAVDAMMVTGSVRWPFRMIEWMEAALPSLCSSALHPSSGHWGLINHIEYDLSCKMEVRSRTSLLEETALELAMKSKRVSKSMRGHRLPRADRREARGMKVTARGKLESGPFMELRMRESNIRNGGRIIYKLHNGLCLNGGPCIVIVGLEDDTTIWIME